MKYKGIAIVIFIFLVISAPVFALDFIVGAKAGYYGWEPYLKEIDASGFSEIDVGTGVLYGPVFSVLFTQDLSLSMAALTGIQSTHWKSNYEPWEGQYLVATYYFESRRTDIDTALSYRVMQNLKVFLGYKYQYIDSELNYTEIRTNAAREINEIIISSGKAETMSHGPALGLGYSLPFGKGFFMAANLSGLYMVGEFKMKDQWKYAYYGGFNDYNISPNNSSTMDIAQYGMNFEPSIGFSAGESGLIFTLGFRYQWLKTEYLDDFPGEDRPLSDANDYLYGVFVSVLYAF